MAGGHTAHATKDEAMEEAVRMLGVYRDFAWETLAVPYWASGPQPNGLRVLTRPSPSKP